MLTMTAWVAVQVGWTIGWIKPMNAKYETGACDGSNMHSYQCNMHCYYWLQSKWDKQIMDEAAFSRGELGHDITSPGAARPVSMLLVSNIDIGGVNPCSQYQVKVPSLF